MNDLATLPLSVRQQLERAQQLSNHSQRESPQSAIVLAVQTLASSNPELCALLMAANLGYRGIDITQTQWETITTKTERRTLGVRTSGSEVSTTTERGTGRTLRL